MRSSRASDKDNRDRIFVGDWVSSASVKDGRGSRTRPRSLIGSQNRLKSSDKLRGRPEVFLAQASGELCLLLESEMTF